jgi:hypothetical protein
MEYPVRHGVQTFVVNGELLAESSSRVGNRPRWVEFKLYRSTAGIYVLSRVGASVYFHSEDCEVVSRNKLSAISQDRLPPIYIPCPDCDANRMDPEGIYPETPRYWAQHTPSPQKIITALQKRDKDGVSYLTNVASRLLISAAQKDERIREIFYTVRIE